MPEVSIQQPFHIFTDLGAGSTSFQFSITNINFDVNEIEIVSVTVEDPTNFSLITSDLVNGEILCAMAAPNVANSSSSTLNHSFVFPSAKSIQGTFTFEFKDMAFVNQIVTNGIVITMVAKQYKQE